MYLSEVDALSALRFGSLSSNNEKRRFTRVTPRAQQPIAVQLIGEGFIEMLRARDISEGGLAVSIHHDVDPSAFTSEVQIIVSLPECWLLSAAPTLTSGNWIEPPHALQILWGWECLSRIEAI